MVDEQIVNSTIKRMLDSEIDEETIISTLTDIGMSQEEAQEKLNSLKGNSQVQQTNTQQDSQGQQVQQTNTQQDSQGQQLQQTNTQQDSQLQQDSQVQENDDIEEQPINDSTSEDEGYVSNEDEIASAKDELAQQAQVKDLHDTTTHNMLNDHSQKIDEVSKKMDSLHSSINSTPKGAPATDANVMKKLEDVSAQVSATLDVMKKVLETDRKILAELEMKK